MPLLEYVVYGNPLMKWLEALLVVLALYLLLRFITRLVYERLRQVAAKSKTTVDDLISKLVRQIKGWFLLIIALAVAPLLLTLPSRLLEIFHVVLVVTMLLQAGFWLNSLVGFWIARRIAEKQDEDAGTATTLNALGIVAKGIVWAIVLLLVLDNIPGIEINTLIASLGITGIAIGLAVQQILGDLFASLSIALDKPFVIGDFIAVGDFLGTVEHIGLKSTRLRSLSGEQLIFSNSDLLNSRIRNYKSLSRRRVVFHFGVTYQTTPQKLAAIPAMLRQIIEGIEKLTFDRTHFFNFGDSALEFEVVYYVEDPDYQLYMDAQQAINLALYQRFADEQIGFAYPTQTIFLEQ